MHYPKKKSQTNNAFTRKYIPHALQKIKQITLPSNDYYIAGIDSCAIYLGNYNAPLYVKEIDFNLFTEKTHQIIIDQYNLPYKRVRIVVQPPYFFVGDGTVPILFRGKITNWKASTLFKEKIYFNQFVPKDSATIAVVTASTKTNTTILGEIKLKPNQLMFTPKEDILVKQINGTFDTDGLLQWNNQAHLYTYLYYYRNQYIVLDQNLQPIVHNKTIDTISKAQIDLAYFEKSKEYKLGSKTIMVNLTATANHNSYFIVSDRMGRFEKDDLSKGMTIIDQYDYKNNRYQHSFYFYHQPQQTMQQFMAYQNYLIGIVDNQLWMYKIKDIKK